MRTKAEVVGIGERRSGVSKKGRAYDFTPFHLIYPDKNTEGLAAAVSNVDQSILDAIPMPKVNDEIEIFCHFYKRKMTTGSLASVVTADILEKALCNPWDWFCTFTISEDKYNRKDLVAWRDGFTQWLRDLRKKGYADPTQVR